MVLGHIAKTFPEGEELDESKVNTLLLNLYPDFALLRRYLVDEGFLARRHDEHPSGRSIVLYRRADTDSTATD